MIFYGVEIFIKFLVIKNFAVSAVALTLSFFSTSKIADRPEPLRFI